MLFANTSVNLLSGVHLSTVYLLVAIALAAVSLYVAIKKNRQDTKDATAAAITDKVLTDSKNEIAEAVKAAVITQVQEAIAKLDYKITQNGKNTNNLGDVAARTEEKVDEVKETVTVLTLAVQKTNDEIVKHLGWHQGWVESKKYNEKEKNK